MNAELSSASIESAGLVVFDIQGEVYGQNRILDPEYAREFHGFEALAKLCVWLRHRGVRSVTADVFLDQPRMPVPTACLSIEQTQYTHALLSRPDVTPAVCLSLESPIMIVPFYQAIPRLSEQYRHMFLWPGTRDRVTGGASFHDMSWPYPEWSPIVNTIPWSERRLLTLVCGNKRAYAFPARWFDLRQPRASVRALAAAARTHAMRRRDPWFRTELYVDRLRAIEYFARRPDFDLYGRGWSDARSTLPARTARAVAKSYRGEIPALGKIQVVSGYKFALCYENTSFPGYITEKIFDCFTASCIPIYRGAPDIAEAVPRESFIDAASFRSLSELNGFLRQMTNTEANCCLDAARKFMASSTADRFSDESFVEAVGEVLIESLRDSHPGTGRSA